MIAAAGVHPAVHFSVAAAALAIAAVAVAPGMLDHMHAEEHASPPSFRVSRSVLILSLLAFCLLLNEGAMADWSSVYLRSSLNTSEAVAAYGYAVFSATMAIGRLVGDRLTVRFGRVEMVRYGALVAAAGLGIALVLGSIATTMAGFAAVGFGFAAIIPLVFGAAGRVEGQSAGSGLATVTTIGYLGFLIGPPLIGYAADLLSLRIALGLVVILSVAGALLAPSVRR